jgi:hypothetical protein
VTPVLLSVLPSLNAEGGREGGRGEESMSSNSVANDPTSRLRSRLSSNAKYVLV